MEHFYLIVYPWNPKIQHNYRFFLKYKGYFDIYSIYISEIIEIIVLKDKKHMSIIMETDVLSTLQFL